MMLLVKLICFILTFIFFTVNGQDDTKFNVQLSDNYYPKMGIHLPWMKICKNNLTQINKAILVKTTYDKKIIDESYKRCKQHYDFYICRAEMSKGTKILGWVSNYLFLF